VIGANQAIFTALNSPGSTADGMCGCVGRVGRSAMGLGGDALGRYVNFDIAFFVLMN
jgi:hypothetical protein